MHKNKICIALFITFCITILIIVFNKSGYLQFLEFSSFDLAFRIRDLGEAAPYPSKDIVIVKIDDESFEKLGKVWPWPRSWLSKGIDTLSNYGASVIGIDLILDYETNENDDKMFASSIKGADNIVLPMVIQADKEKFSPITLFKSNACDIGFINVNLSHDNKLRFIKLVENDRMFFSLAVLMRWLNLNEDDIEKSQSYIKIGKYKIHLTRDKMMVLNIPQSSARFNEISFHKVISGDIDERDVKGKIVLVGKTYQGSKDFVATAIQPKVPGIEVLAHVINSIICGESIYIVTTVNYPIMFILVFITLLAVLVPSKNYASFIFAVIEVSIIILASLYLFIKSSYIIPMFLHIFGISLGLVSGITFKLVKEGIEKRRIKSYLISYVSPKIVEKALKELPSIGGERKIVTVLFSDIRSYTQFMRETNLEDGFKRLNEYLAAMSSSVAKYGGTIDKFIGDAIMVIYGVDKRQGDEAISAVKTAFDMKDKLVQLNSKYDKKLRLGIGIHEGEVQLGHIGSSWRMDFTAIGHAVNFAQRLESKAGEIQNERNLDVAILVSGEIYSQIKETVTAEKIENISLKGMDKPITAYLLQETKF